MKTLPLFKRLQKRSRTDAPCQRFYESLWTISAPAILALTPSLVPSAAMANNIAGNIFVEPVKRPSQPFSLPTTSRLPVPSSDILCSYLPSNGQLGRDAIITLIESQGDSVFRYERLNERLNGRTSARSNGTRSTFSFATSTTPNNIASNIAPNATISRTLTFRNTSANQAGRRLINRPDEYADLLGLDPSDSIVRAGFGAIASQFTCQPFSSVARAATTRPSNNNLPSDNLPPLTRQATSLAALPDGNYRVASPAAIEGSDTTDAYSASTLFTFRKLGDVVTGNFEYLNSDRQACISGNVTGNIITGQAYTDSGETFVLSRRYLGPSLTLELGEAVTFSRYDDSVLDLNGFTRINAGKTQPPIGCS